MSVTVSQLPEIKTSSLIWSVYFCLRCNNRDRRAWQADQSVSFSTLPDGNKKLTEWICLWLSLLLLLQSISSKFRTIVSMEGTSPVI